MRKQNPKCILQFKSRTYALMNKRLCICLCNWYISHFEKNKRCRKINALQRCPPLNEWIGVESHILKHPTLIWDQEKNISYDYWDK
jgi:hypothetical protein